MERVTYFNNLFCSGSVYCNTNSSEPIVRVNGKIKDKYVPSKSELYYWAANPAQRNLSSKSALPYANPEQAFDRSPNIGKVPIVDGEFNIEITYPSAYYVGLGSVLIDPSLHIRVSQREDLFDTIQLGEGYPYRTLTYPSDRRFKAREGPMFYHQENLPIRTQEQILRDSAYPQSFNSKTNFWGLRPAQ